MEIGSVEWSHVVAHLFGVRVEAVHFHADVVTVGNRRFQLDRGVILLDEQEVHLETERGTVEDVRRSFSEEWRSYGTLMPEHELEFAAYFDLLDINSLKDSVVVDLGCGSGRWSSKLAQHCRIIVLVDFSDAIFVAKENMANADNAIFFRGDVTNLPFADSSVDLLFSLGVLHHLDQPCLPIARHLMRLGPQGLFYLYYALDNRPWYFKSLLQGVTGIRSAMGRVKSERARRRISRALAVCVYRPMVGLGRAVERLGLNSPVPLSETYRRKSIDRIEQDAYDRFFTSIEQRVSREDIERAFSPEWRVTFSEREPFWHFLVEMPY